MLEVDDEPMETLHIYVVREAAPKPSLFPLVLSGVAFSVLIAIGVLAALQQPVTRDEIRVPAVPLTTKSFTTQIAVIPTGIRTYPATTAHGLLTITNGSVISQTLPAGLIFITNSGVSVRTDAAVFVPAGNAYGYGYAVVRAHAAIPGKAGNISAYAMNQVVGSSVYVRNLTVFRGGKDAYSVKVATAQDRQTALAKARQHLAVISTGLHYPCFERISGSVRVTWLCQFLIYHIPAYMHVTRVTIQGKYLLVAVVFIARPVHLLLK
jgi:hypothetical protein